MNMTRFALTVLLGLASAGCSAGEETAKQPAAVPSEPTPETEAPVTVVAPKLSKEEIAKRREEFKARIEARKKARAEALKKADKDPSAHPTHAAPGGLRREVEDLKSEVKALRAEIEALKAKTGKEQGK